jgi:hypothetical protein
MSGGEFHHTPEELPPSYDDLSSERLAKNAMFINNPGLINPIIKILKDRLRNDPFNKDLAVYVHHVEKWRDDCVMIEAGEIKAAQIARFDDVMIGFTMPVDRRMVVLMDKIERDALEALSRDAKD